MRTAEKGIVQFTYGDDGLDPVMMMDGISPVLFKREWENVRSQNPCPAEPALDPMQFDRAMAILDTPEFKQLSTCFVEALREFLRTKHEAVRARAGLGSRSLSCL